MTVILLLYVSIPQQKKKSVQGSQQGLSENEEEEEDDDDEDDSDESESDEEEGEQGSAPEG